MQWVQVLTIIIAIVCANMGIIIPLFLWNRSEARQDYRHLESALTSALQGIREEMKDFHGRLCAIEENRK